MTTESNHNDPRVSEAYQGLATETTPPELDHKILAMAAQARPRYGLARAWISPVAWAATIGLSLAIVLEISQLQHETRRIDADSRRAAAQRTAETGKFATCRAEAATASDVELATDSVRCPATCDRRSDLPREAEEQARSRSGPDRLPRQPLTHSVSTRQRD